jgi:GNAT superfamily N-acetyltransferase
MPSADVKGVRVEAPEFTVEVKQVGWNYWELFKPHHYLDAGHMAFGTAFVGFVGEEPVVHIGMSGKVSGKRREARACRMVVMPEWQGAGVGMRVLNALCERELAGEGFIGKPATTLFHTAHPGLVLALRRDRRWRQLSAFLGGGGTREQGGGWGKHFRAVSGWRYYGQAGLDAEAK